MYFCVFVLVRPHFVYESDSTPLVSNKQKFDDRERTFFDERNSIGHNGLTRAGMGKGLRRTNNKERELNNGVTKKEEGFKEASLLLDEQKHSLSN